MIKDWEIKRLGEVLTLEYGKPLPETDRSPKGKFPVYGANGIKTRTDKFYCDQYSIIVGRKGSAGEVTLTEEKFWPLDVTYFVTFDDKKFNLKYLFWLLKSLNLPSYATGVKPGINRNEIYNIEIKVPPLTEQKRIVKILDDKLETLEKLKDVTEAQSYAARELFVSRSEELLTNSNEWEEKTIGDVCFLENGDRGKNYPSNAKLQMEGIPFVSAGNLQEQGIALSERNYLSDKQYSLLRSGKFTSGDILFCLRGSLGKYAYVNSIDKGAIASSLVIVRPKDIVSKEYLMSYFGSGLCKKMIEKYSGGAAQPNLGAKDLKKFLIYVPTLKEQKVICDELATLKGQTKELEQVFRRKIANLGELKKSYLNEAFSGKL
ncbi:MAG: hypothetical protein RJA61_185 [Candidatus Parcubacteria bacterium]|jgi:type I restriction enzyme S subunit